MSISSKASKLLTNKYVLYIVLFFAITTVFGYMSLNDTNSVILFALISLVASIFTKNMIVILGLSVILTNMIVVSKGKNNSSSFKEGLENQTDNATNANTNANANAQKVKPAVANPKPKSTTPNVSSQATAAATAMPTESMKNINENKKGGSNRIDYASTLEEAYDNLDSILGGEGIKQLTTDTQKLMSKQQELFKSMENMAPMLNQAKSMLEGFDMKSLQGLAGFASNFGSNSKEKDKK